MIQPNILLFILGALSLTFIIYLFNSKILERYFLIETLKPFFICLFIITFIMLIERLFDLMNIIIEKQLDVLTIINLFVLSFPFIFALSVPMAVLTSTIMAFGRMSVDKELIAIKSTGVNVIKLTKLLGIFMLIVSLGMAYFNDYILPETNHLLKNVVLRVTYKKPITAIKPGTFTTMNHITILAKERDSEALYDLLIYNLENVRFPQTIYAKKGEIYLDPVTDQLKVILYDGEMYERDIAEAEKYQISTFEQYTFFLTNLGYGDDDTTSDYRGDREMTSLQMKAMLADRQMQVDYLNAEIENIINSKRINESSVGNAFIRSSSDMDHDWNSERINAFPTDDGGSVRINAYHEDEIRRQNIMLNLHQSQKSEIERQMRRFHVEMNKKYSLGAACFVFFLVGLAIGMMTKSSGVGVSFVFSLIIFIIYYIFLVLGEELGEKNIINPIFSMWFPSIFFLIVGFFLIHIARKEKSFDVMIIWRFIVKIALAIIPNKWRRNARSR